jgi:hypothetical protein
MAQDKLLRHDARCLLRVLQDGRHFVTVNHDAAGNRRHVRTRHRDDDTQRDYDDWYDYDAMGRQTMVDGVRRLLTGVIAVDQGHRLSHDRNGNRLRGTTYSRHAFLYTPAPLIDSYGGRRNPGACVPDHRGRRHHTPVLRAVAQR